MVEVSPTHVQPRRGALTLADVNHDRRGYAEYREIANRNGILLAQAKYSEVRRAGEFAHPGDQNWYHHLNLAGWLDHSFFHVHEFVTGSTRSGERVAGHNFSESFSIGEASMTNPQGGSATWSGTMAGVRRDRFSVLLSPQAGTLNHRVLGDATIMIDDFSNPDVDVVLNNITNTDTGENMADMIWDDLPLTRGVFRGEGMTGSFYGPNHEEVGGAFYRENVGGAFGAKRE